MRTKTLLLSAALGIATAVPALAQTNVYSVNAVGYVNVGFPAGFSIRANPLNALPNNALSVIFDTNAVPVNTKIYRYDTSTTPASFKIYTAELDDNDVKGWGANNGVQLNPGEGFFVNSPAPGFTNTFVGEVPQKTASNQQIPLGFSLKSSVVPQAGQLDTVLKYPPTVGDKIYRLNADGKTYTISEWELDDNGNPQWTKAPAPNVGEGFWVLAKAAKPWNRDFDVNQ